MAKRTLRIPNWKLCDLFQMERTGPEIMEYEVEWELTDGGGPGSPGGPKGVKRTKKHKENYRKAWTKKRKEAQSKALKGNNRNKNNRIPVTIDGVKYESKLAASKALGISRKQVSERAKSIIL